MNKAITVKQPWAYLLCAGIKDVENRTWSLPEKYRGERVFIHASGKPDKEPYMLFSDAQIESIGDNRIMDVVESYEMTSAIIGSCRFIDCVTNHPSVWAEHWVTKDWHNGVFGGTYDKEVYNWVVTEPILFAEPILDVKGKLSFWDCSEFIDRKEVQP